MLGKRGGFVVGVVALQRHPRYTSRAPEKPQDALQAEPPRPGARTLRCSLKYENKSRKQDDKGKDPSWRLVSCS